MPKLIARDGKGLLVHLDNDDLRKIGIQNGTYYSSQNTGDAEAVRLIGAALDEHRKATALILAYGDLPKILADGLKKLNDYAEARTRLVLAHVEPEKAEKVGRAS